jgi:hypothetical protein
MLSREKVQIVTPPTHFWSEGGVVGVLTHKNDPPTRVCSEGGSVSMGCVVVVVVVVVAVVVALVSRNVVNIISIIQKREKKNIPGTQYASASRIPVLVSS